MNAEIHLKQFGSDLSVMGRSEVTFEDGHEGASFKFTVLGFMKVYAFLPSRQIVVE